MAGTWQYFYCKHIKHINSNHLFICATFVSSDLNVSSSISFSLIMVAILSSYDCFSIASLSVSCRSRSIHALNLSNSAVFLLVSEFSCSKSVFSYKCNQECFNSHKWAASWQNQQNDCASSEDSEQSGHPPSLISLRCALNGLLWTQAFFMRTAKTLIRLGAHAIFLVLSWGGSNTYLKINMKYRFRVCENKDRKWFLSNVGILPYTYWIQ